jgi:hypothetical protein
MRRLMSTSPLWIAVASTHSLSRTRALAAMALAQDMNPVSAVFLKIQTATWLLQRRNAGSAASDRAILAV